MYQVLVMQCTSGFPKYESLRRSDAGFGEVQCSGKGLPLTEVTCQWAVDSHESSALPRQRPGREYVWTGFGGESRLSVSLAPRQLYPAHSACACFPCTVFQKPAVLRNMACTWPPSCRRWSYYERLLPNSEHGRHDRLAIFSRTVAVGEIIDQ